MGTYTDNLFKRKKLRSASKPKNAATAKAKNAPAAERLVAVAIHFDYIDGTDADVKHGFRSHAELRGSLGYDFASKPIPGTVDGFWTSNERFVTRREAHDIALESGQLSRPQVRELLSSDINWDSY